MIHTALTLLLLAAPEAPLAATGASETIKAGKVDMAVAGATPLRFETTGGIVFDVRAESAKPKSVEVILVRDGRFESRAKLSLKPNKKGAPKGFIAHAKVGIVFADAAPHVVTIVSADGSKLAIQGTRNAKVPKPLLAGPEKDLGPPADAPAPVAAAPTTPAAPEPAAPAPAAPPAPSPTAAPAAAPAEVVAAASPADMLGGASALPSAESEAAAAAEASRSGLRQAIRVAVYDFELSGVEPSLGTVVTDSVLAEVRKLSGVAAIGMDEIRDMLSHEANKQILGCEDNESCLAEIAGALGVDFLVSGKLSKVDDGSVFLARRIDQRRAKVVGVVNQRLKAESGQEFLAAIGPSIEELFPDYTLKPGVSRGVAAEVALRLDPPPLPRWSVFTVGGLGAAGALVGVFFGLEARNAEQDYNKRAQDSVNQLIPGRELVDLKKKADSSAQIANIAYISAGALGVAAAVMALFTDWYGYGDAAEASAGP